MGRLQSEKEDNNLDLSGLLVLELMIVVSLFTTFYLKAFFWQIIGLVTLFLECLTLAHIYLKRKEVTKMPEGNQGVAILLLLALVVGGVLITFNIGDFLGIGFGSIHNIQSGVWIILARLVGIVLIILPIWVIFKMLTDSY